MHAVLTFNTTRVGRREIKKILRHTHLGVDRLALVHQEEPALEHCVQQACNKSRVRAAHLYNVQRMAPEAAFEGMFVVVICLSVTRSCFVRDS